MIMAAAEDAEAAAAANNGTSPVLALTREETIAKNGTFFDADGAEGPMVVNAFCRGCTTKGME